MSAPLPVWAFGDMARLLPIYLHLCNLGYQREGLPTGEGWLRMIDRTRARPNDGLIYLEGHGIWLTAPSYARTGALGPIAFMNSPRQLYAYILTHGLAPSAPTPHP